MVPQQLQHLTKNNKDHADSYGTKRLEREGHSMVAGVSCSSPGAPAAEKAQGPSRGRGRAIPSPACKVWKLLHRSHNDQAGPATTMQRSLGQVSPDQRRSEQIRSIGNEQDESVMCSASQAHGHRKTAGLSRGNNFRKRILRQRLVPKRCIRLAVFATRVSHAEINPNSRLTHELQGQARPIFPFFKHFTANALKSRTPIYARENSENHNLFCSKSSTLPGNKDGCFEGPT